MRPTSRPSADAAGAFAPRGAALGFALLSLLACSAAGAQEPPAPQGQLTVRVPGGIHPLAGPVRMRIEGQEIDPGSVSYQVHVFGQNVTAGVVESEQVLSGSDTDGDGRLEDYALEIVADLSNLPLEQLDNSLILYAWATSSGAPLHESGHGPITVPYTVTAEVGNYEIGSGMPLRYWVSFEGVYSPTWSFTIEKNGQDVTQAVTWSKRTWEDHLDRDGMVLWRLESVEIDPSSISLDVGDTLSLVVSASVVFDGETYVLPIVNAIIQILSAQQRQALAKKIRPCLQTFVDATGLHKDGENSPVTFGPNVKGDANSTGNLADAARVLRDCILQVQFTGSIDVKVGGLTFLVGKGELEGTADVVVVVSGDGKDATATNEQPGGAAVAAAGDGNPGQSGGDAKSTTSGGGASLAVGGDGGEGLDGADGPSGGRADAIETSGQGPAFAQGGDGGMKKDPNDPKTEHGDGGPGAVWNHSDPSKATNARVSPGGNGDTTSAGSGGKAWLFQGVSDGQNGTP